MRNFKTKLSFALSAVLIVTLLGCATLKPLYTNKILLTWGVISYVTALVIIPTYFILLQDIEYTGNKPELFTEAVHSLLGVRGHHSHGNSYIEIREEDIYGRILFSYAENERYIYLLITQKSDSVYTYYYPDFNFIKMEKEYGQDAPFSEQEILELKDKNDWNKPLDESKFIKQKIVRIKANRDKKLKDEYKLDKSKLFRGIEYLTYECRDEYLTSDEYGRKLFACGSTVILTNTDGACYSTTCFIKLTDQFNYQHELKAFKERNKWNIKP